MAATGEETNMHTPVQFRAEPPAGPRNRISALLRPVLIIPHVLLVGGPFVGLGATGIRTGAFGLVAVTVALLDWFAILITGHPLGGLQPYKRIYLRWRARALAYAAFLRDEYPPFGEGDHPATLELPDDPPVRDRAMVALRPLLIIPHVLMVLLVLAVAAAATIVAWVLLIVTGAMPAWLWRFNHDALAYMLRVETYALLVHDVFPPFSLAADRDLLPATPAP